MIVPGFLPDVPEVREDLAGYYTALSRLDTGFGRVLDALDRSGQRDDTLVIVMSDHGMPFPGAKASSFDSEHHCPLIVRNPANRVGGTTRDALVNWTDMLPTILDWFGVKGPPLQGRSFLPVLKTNNPSGWDETTYSHSFHEVNNYYPYRVIRQLHYKYVLNLFPELTLPLPTDLFASRHEMHDYIKEYGEPWRRSIRP